MTWSVVILLEIRTLVEVPNVGVKMEVCRDDKEQMRQRHIRSITEDVQNPNPDVAYQELTL